MTRSRAAWAASCSAWGSCLGARRLGGRVGSAEGTLVTVPPAPPSHLGSHLTPLCAQLQFRSSSSLLFVPAVLAWLALGQGRVGLGQLHAGEVPDGSEPGHCRAQRGWPRPARASGPLLCSGSRTAPSRPESGGFTWEGEGRGRCLERHTAARGQR